MMVAVVYESSDGLAPLEVVEALAGRFGVQWTTRQVLQTARANPKLFLETEGKIRRPSDSPPEFAEPRMDLKGMVVAVVYESPDGLAPVDLLEVLTRRFGVESTTKQVLHTVRANPRLFIETEGKVKRPSDSLAEFADSKMDLKDMMVAVVYESPDGLTPVDVVEAMTRRFGLESNTKQVLQAVRANPKLFVEMEGRVKRPSGSPEASGDSRMDLKDMMVAVVYESRDGLAPLEVVEAIARRFGVPSTTKEVLQTMRAHPNLFAETYGRVNRPSGN
jgi:hypothetical protein